MRLQLFLPGLVFALPNIAWAAPTPAEIFERAICVLADADNPCEAIGFTACPRLPSGGVFDPMVPCEGLPGAYSTIWCQCYKTTSLKKKKKKRKEREGLLNRA